MLKRLRNKFNRNHQKNCKGQTRRKMQFEALEPRILLSADLGLEHPAALQPDGQSLAITQPLNNDMSEESLLTIASGVLSADNADLQPPPLISSATNELIVVDSSVPDYQKLIDHFSTDSNHSVHYEIYLLDSLSDGIGQISEILQDHNDLSALHILSHGSTGQLTLGQGTLEIGNLPRYQQALEGWGAALAEEGDILLYGCSVAAGAVGIDFVESIAELTSADVAASTDVTGSVVLGGDW